MLRKTTFIHSFIEASFLKAGVRRFSARVAPVVQGIKPDLSIEENGDIDWNDLGFTLVQTDYMYMAKCKENNGFEQGQINRFGSIELNPAAGVLNYGQGIFEGTKACRTDDGRILLFRPDQNAIRMQIGANRMCMPPPSTEQFVDALKRTILANKRWVPPSGKGSLYLRPLLLANGPVLGVSSASEYTFLVYASPVANYFKVNTGPLNLYVDDDFHRATRGGVGFVKSITNYAPVLKAMSRAKEQGFSDVLYLDSVNKRYVEEVSTANIFLVKGNTISTPAAIGTILEGITRKSIIDIARDLGYKVEERLIPVEELMEAEEVFITGTAVSVATVGSITYHGKRVQYKSGNGLVSQKLYKTLVGIQKGEIKDKNDWVVEIN